MPPSTPPNLSRPGSIGTNQHPFRLAGGAVLTPVADGAQSGPGAYADFTTNKTPTELNDPGNGVAVIGPLERDDNLLLQFFHTHESDANDLTSNVHIWAVRRYDPPGGGDEVRWRGVYLGSLDLTSGQAENSDYGPGLSGWCDTVAPTSNTDFTLAPGMRTQGGGTDGVQQVLFDKVGAEYLIFEAEATAASAAEGVGIEYAQV